MSLPTNPATALLKRLEPAFARTRQGLENARQLPGEVYCSAEIAALERDVIWRASWLCVAHVDELPTAGSYLTGSVMEDAYLLVRNEAGAIQAFVNKCRHRGVPVAEGRGCATKFRCPYHAWLYDLDGKLVAAPHMQRTNVDLGTIGLAPQPMAVWRGWIFVCLGTPSVPFDVFIRPYDAEYWWYQADKCKLADVVSIPVACNWKLLVENLIDMYHVPIIHQGTFGKFSKSPRDQIRCTLIEGGGWTLETEARPHSNDGRQLFPSLPWLTVKSSGVSLKAGIFPNLNVSARTDALRLWSLWPVAVDRTELRLHSLYAPEAFDAPGFKERHEESKEMLSRAITDEDGPMVVALQKSVASPQYEPGPMCFLEDGVHHIMRHYLDVIAPAKSVAPRSLQTTE